MKKINMKRSVKLVTSVFLAFSLFSVSGCSSTGTSYKKNKNLNTKESVTLFIAGQNESNKGLELVIQKFEEIYPNVNIEYEYVQDFDTNVLPRLDSDTGKFDLFTKGKISDPSDYLPYTLNLLEYKDEVNLDNTFDGMIENFSSKDQAGNEVLYSVPLGGDLRGMYVNKTLLNSLGIEVPTNATELLLACEKIKEAGYMPFGGNPGVFGQRLLFPYIASITTQDNNYDTVNHADDACVELFQKPFELLYGIVENDYYKYKYVETELNMFTDLSSEAIASNFLGYVADENGNYTQKYPLGMFAFIAEPNNLFKDIEQMKEDYHSEIEVEFILAPVTDEGGVAYLSPSTGISINKKSDHVDWCLEFIQFLFTDECAKEYANTMNIIPNTKDALDIISEKYGVEKDSIGQLGDMVFDYPFYETITQELTDISKANNPKYMEDDGSGNVKMYSYDHYMDLFKEALATQRETLK